ncbi:MAG: hypothetical protein NT150_09620 [Bacteroidetes bacterium]|nr:hypothetical protein [Bacteroidota bacterium]
MKTQTFVKSGLILLTSFGLLLTSCKKDDNSTTAAEDHAMSEQTADDMDAIADEAESSNKLSSFKTDEVDGILADSVVITKTIKGDTISVTVDFGTTGIVCKDGKTRKGKIKFYRIGNPLNQGSVRIATTDGYSVNGNGVVAQRTVTFNGLQATNGHPSWNIAASYTITLADGSGTITGTTARLREWSEGSSTPLVRADDVFIVSGTASGTKANGTEVAVEITTPLTFKASCHQIVSGVIKITPSEKETRTIDFGTGDCDDTVTVTVGKKTKTFTAKK